MKKAAIYTRKGDGGETGLVSGSRFPKSDPRIELYGEVDELNSRVGHAIYALVANGEFKSEVTALQSVQATLFDLGANLACEPSKRSEWKLPLVTGEHTRVLESEIDRMEASLAPLKSFILPGGTEAASLLHLCRTATRRVERLLVGHALTSGEHLPGQALPYINRLSDYFFVLARWVNHRCGHRETPWKPS